MPTRCIAALTNSLVLLIRQLDISAIAVGVRSLAALALGICNVIQSLIKSARFLASVLRATGQVTALGVVAGLAGHGGENKLAGLGGVHNIAHSALVVVSGSDLGKATRLGSLRMLGAAVVVTDQDVGGVGRALIRFEHILMLLSRATTGALMVNKGAISYLATDAALVLGSADGNPLVGSLPT